MAEEFDFDEYIKTEYRERSKRWQLTRCRLPSGRWIWCRKLGDRLRLIDGCPKLETGYRYGDIVKVEKVGDVLEVVRRVFPQLYSLRYRPAPGMTVEEGWHRDIGNRLKTALAGSAFEHYSSGGVAGEEYLLTQAKVSMETVLEALRFDGSPVTTFTVHNADGSPSE
jgi:hypothetical protein